METGFILVRIKSLVIGKEVEVRCSIFQFQRGKLFFLRIKTKKFGKFLKLKMPSIFNPLINFMFMKKVA